MEREQNEEHTKEESRTLQSEFEVNDYIPLIAFNVCSLSLRLFFLNLNNKPSVMADEDTRSWESAVDIIADTAPEIKSPASIGCMICFDNNGIAFSGSIITKYEGPK